MHFHIDYLHFPMSRRLTGSARDDAARPAGPARPAAALPRRFRDMPLVSISDAQRRPLPRGRTGCAPCYHGLPPDLYRCPAARRRLLRVPRPDLAREAADRAIEIAKALRRAAQDRGQGRQGRPRLLRRRDRAAARRSAGRVHRRDRRAREGRRSSATRAALLFPIDWPEPFGLVMIEAMACGTPVIAFGCGSVPEVIDDGVTGFIVDDMDAGGRGGAPHRQARSARCAATPSSSASRPRAWRAITVAVLSRT